MIIGGMTSVGLCVSRVRVYHCLHVGKHSTCGTLCNCHLTGLGRLADDFLLLVSVDDLADEHVYAVAHLLPPDTGDVDDSRSSDGDEGNQAAKDLLGARGEGQAGDTARKPNGQKHRCSCCCCVGCAELLVCHFDRLVRVAEVYGDVQGLVAHLPEDDGAEGGVGHQHAGADAAISELERQRSERQVTDLTPIQGVHSQQVGRHKCTHPKRQRHRLARIRMDRRVNKLLGMVKPRPLSRVDPIPLPPSLLDLPIDLSHEFLRIGELRRRRKERQGGGDRVEVG